MRPGHLTHLIKAEAHALGFDRVGVAAATGVTSAPRLRAWLALGYHGEMSYLAGRLELRADPRLWLPKARSMIVLALNYFHPATAPAAESISRYARGDDYHLVMGNKLKRLLDFIKREEPGCDGRSFVDSGTVMEKYWAAQAGIGWQGKHSLIISPPLGSWIFLGGIITTLELEADQPVEDRCGFCRRCLDACPTGAIVRPYVVDARRCISYHTIERKADRAIPADIAAAMADQIFGCDICQQVCPFNENPVPTREPAFRPRPNLLQMTMKDFDELDEDSFKRLFIDSSVLRIRYDGLKRNLQAVQSDRMRRDR